MTEGKECRLAQRRARADVPVHGWPYQTLAITSQPSWGPLVTRLLSACDSDWKVLGMPTNFWAIPLPFWPWIIFVGFMLAGVIYVIPALVAMARGHSNRFTILVLNIFLGWTVVGWVFALVWSLAEEPRPRLGTTKP